MIDNKVIIEYKAYLRNNLSTKRYIHSLNVADEAVKLAEIYGVNSEKAYIAGLLHDICKEMSEQDLKQIVSCSDMTVEQIEMNEPKLWHAIAGAEFIRNHFDINDEEILWAIRLHTSGSDDMSRLAEILYMADLISIDRKYDDVDRIRKLSYENINLALLEALKFSLKDLILNNKIIPESSFRAYNKYENLYKNSPAC